MLLKPEMRQYSKYSIEKTLEIFRERNLKYIVEIGCMRMPMNHPINELHISCCMDGHSSIFWAKETDDFVTVDMSLSATQNAIMEVKKHLGKDISSKVYKNDGIEFLKNYNNSIDLLFLDFCDADLPESPELHLKAYEITNKKNLHDKSLILVDDTDVELINNELHFCENGNKGKGELLIPQAIRDGWKVIFNGRQTLLSK